MRRRGATGGHRGAKTGIFSERELMFTFAICPRPSVCRLSVTFVHPIKPIEIFGNVSAPFNTLVTWRHPGKIWRGLNQRVVENVAILDLSVGNGAR